MCVSFLIIQCHSVQSFNTTTTAMESLINDALKSMPIPIVFSILSHAFVFAEFLSNNLRG